MIANMSEEQSVEIISRIFRDAGLDFRRKKPNEEGGFFYKENGIIRKFNGNIFVKRLLKYENGMHSKDETPTSDS